MRLLRIDWHLWLCGDMLASSPQSHKLLLSFFLSFLDMPFFSLTYVNIRLSLWLCGICLCK